MVSGVHIEMMVRKWQYLAMDGMSRKTTQLDLQLEPMTPKIYLVCLLISSCGMENKTSIEWSVTCIQKWWSENSNILLWRVVPAKRWRLTFNGIHWLQKLPLTQQQYWYKVAGHMKPRGGMENKEWSFSHEGASMGSWGLFCHQKCCYRCQCNYKKIGTSRT